MHSESIEKDAGEGFTATSARSKIDNCIRLALRVYSNRRRIIKTRTNTAQAASSSTNHETETRLENYNFFRSYVSQLYGKLVWPAVLRFSEGYLSAPLKIFMQSKQPNQKTNSNHKHTNRLRMVAYVITRKGPILHLGQDIN